MATYRFRLASLLKIREAARDERRTALLEARQAEDVLLSRLEALAQELAALSGQYRRAATAEKVNIDRLVDAERYELVVKSERKLAENQLELLRKEIERRRESLVAAERAVRVLEKLRETQHLEHRTAEAMLEVKRLDEVASSRYRPEEVL